MALRRGLGSLSKDGNKASGLKGWLFFAFFLMLAGNAMAATYYVSNAGSDSNDGLSEQRSIKTIGRLNDIGLNAGDQVLFRKGDLWRMTSDEFLDVKSGSDSGYITYGAYGSGAKPLFLGSVEANRASQWTSIGGNVWRYTGSISADVGNLIFDNGASVGVKKSSSSDLRAQGDYYYDSAARTVRLYSTTNPAEMYGDIEMAVKTDIFNIDNAHHVAFKGLDLRYGARHGIGGINSHHITIENCDIGYIGGGGPGTRLGNGIEFGLGSTDIRVVGNYIYQVYDAGITCQAWESGGARRIVNHYYANNIIEDCAYGFEYFNKVTGSETSNIVFERNTIVDSGRNWARAQGGNAGRTLRLAATISNTKGMVFTDNIFLNSDYREVYLYSGYPSGSVRLNNNLYYKGAPNMFTWGSSTYSDLAAFKSGTGQESRGIQTTDKGIIDADFRPKEGSVVCTMSSSGSYVGAVPCGTSAAICGDGSCSGIETCESCSQDCGACSTGAWPDGWDYRKELTIAKAGDLVDFPVLVNMSDADLRAKAQADGDDIIFMDPDGSRLAHEIDHYSAGELVAWVKVPRLSAATETKIHMYYGNAQAVRQDAKAVWDGYLAVYHMTESRDRIRDSVSGLEVHAPDVSMAQGKIAGAEMLDGQDIIRLPQVFRSERQFTIEGWVNPSAVHGYIFSQWDDSGNGAFLQYYPAEGNFQLYVGNRVVKASASVGAWHHVIGTFDGSRLRLYIDGRNPVTASGISFSWPAIESAFGNRLSGGRAFSGILDEMRFSPVARNDSYAKAAYLSQSSPKTFVTAGAEQTA
jgi:hypothetical protein